MLEGEIAEFHSECYCLRMRIQDTPILITGSEGFIGRNLQRELSSRYCKVVCLDKKLPNENIGCVDLLNFEGLEKIFERYRPKTIMHLAAQTDVRKSIENPETDAVNNIIGTINISEIAKKYDVKKFVYFNSGGAIYDQNYHQKPTEESKTDPISPYGISKLAGESYAKQILKDDKIDFLSVRLSNVYGKGQTNGVISKFIYNFASGLPCDFYGDGSSTRNYLHIMDLIEFLATAFQQKLSGVYNLGSESTISLKELFDTIALNFSTQPEVRYLKSIENEITHSDLNIDKALKTGWKPIRSFNSEIEKLIFDKDSHGVFMPGTK